MLEADYSSALTILLRYPSSPEYRAVTFVQDALYLRSNLSIAGGSHIISQYSGKDPAAGRRKGRSADVKNQTPKTDGRTPARAQKKSIYRPTSPLQLPAHYFRKQGIDVLLHDAAKAVYQRGEKWGVNQAVRDAVDEVKKNMQGLQTGSPPPRREMAIGRWSLDEGGYAQEPPKFDLKSVERLEERNKVLARMLEEALEELDRYKTGQQKGEQRIEEDAAAWGLAVAKVQFVKSHLADSDLALIEGEEAPKDVSAGDADNADVNQGELSPTEKATPRSFIDSNSHPPSSAIDPILPFSDVPAESTIENENSTTENSVYLTPKNGNSSLQGSRPSLADSPFSWMLGENNNNSNSNNSNNDLNDWRSGFNASFPTPATERTRIQLGYDGKKNKKADNSKVGFLFGGGDDRTGDDKGEKKKNKNKKKHRDDDDDDNDDDYDRGNVFNLASWKGNEGR